MAKKKITPTPTPIVVDPLVEKVRHLRSQGYDDNRIAALLSIQVGQVKEIK